MISSAYNILFLLEKSTFLLWIEIYCEITKTWGIFSFKKKAGGFDDGLKPPP